MSTGKKRSFDAAFKLMVIEIAEKETNRGVAAKFSIDEKSIREWRKNKDALMALPATKKRLTGGGRKAEHPEIEEELMEWIEGLRAQNLRVTRASIQRKALELSHGHGGHGEFTASRGWLEKFFRRKGLSLRRRTTVSQRLPSDLVLKVFAFIIGIRNLRMKKQYPLSQIGNMDETPLWLDMPGETTVTHTGVRSVPIRTTGHEKARFTVVLSAMADGRKLKPFVVFKGVRRIPELHRAESGVIVSYSRNGWMNEDLTKEWVKQVWGTLNFSRRLLVWDAYRCHIMDSVKSFVNKTTNSDISVIPGGLTSLVQPADVSWNKPFKEAYKLLFNEWMIDGEKSFTPAGNVRAPSKLLCINWVKKAWDSVTREVVVRSFETCGISVSIDGQEDGKVHCLKEGGVAEPAKALIEAKTQALLQPQDVDDDEDPFPDLDFTVPEDESELEENEIAVFTDSD